MLRKLLLIASLSFILIGCGTINTRDTAVRESIPFQPTKATKVVLVVLENTLANDALKQPFLGRLAKEGAYLSNYHAVAHPSQPNYMAIVSGSIQGVDGDNPPKVAIDEHHLHLGSKMESWKVYAEDYPGGCEPEKNAGAYKSKHVPFLNFKDMQENKTRCEKHIISFSSEHNRFRDVFKPDDLDSFSLVIPNLNHDAHGNGIFFGLFDDHAQLLKNADDWLKDNFGNLIGDEKFMRDVLFIVTFDENDTSWWHYGSDNDNRVYTVLLGKDVKPCDADNKNCSVHYDHYDLLYTMESILHVDHIKTEENKDARPIGGIW